MPSREIEAFIARWSAASPSERANSQLFLAELCDVLEVPRPDPQHNSGYAFEHPVTEHHLDGSTSQGRIDLFKRACFVLESKQFQEAKAEASQLQLAAQEAGVVAKKKSSQPVRGSDAWDWPKSLAERVQAAGAALHQAATPVTSADLAQQFARARPADVEEILQTLVTLGRAHRNRNQYTR